MLNPAIRATITDKPNTILEVGLRVEFWIDFLIDLRFVFLFPLDLPSAFLSICSISLITFKIALQLIGRSLGLRAINTSTKSANSSEISGACDRQSKVSRSGL